MKITNTQVKTSKFSVLVLLVGISLLLGGSFSCAENFENGFEAYERGDFSNAMRMFRLVAEQGISEAQYNLGFIYDNGQGVPQNDKEAVKWYRKSAEQGYLDAQNNLGMMYMVGEGVPQDNIYAHAWFNIAASNGSDLGAGNRDKVVKEMTKDQIAEAQRLVRECVKKNYKDC